MIFCAADIDFMMRSGEIFFDAALIGGLLYSVLLGLAGFAGVIFLGAPTPLIRERTSGRFSCRLRPSVLR
jgi:hypothetical protein